MSQEVTFEITEETVVLQVVEQPIVFEIGDGFPVSISGPANTVEEILIGEIDNDNKVFTTTYEYLTNSTAVYKNGLRLRKDVHYEESGFKTILLFETPLNYGGDDELTIIYIKV